MHTSRSQVRRGVVRAVVGLLAVLGLVGVGGPASAAEGQIDHVQTESGAIRVLYSIPGIGSSVEPDLKSLSVTIDGKPVPADARLATDAQGTVRRTSILAFDVSQSMRGSKFAEAKRAAEVFLDTIPADVYVGVVTFAGDVRIAQQPTLDRAALKDVVNGLTLSLGTRLYDGVKEAVRVSGKGGQRSVLVLSDGRDTSDTLLTSVTDAVSSADVKVDVVALAQSKADKALLRGISDAGGGALLSADDPAALSKVFASEAEALARQILVSVSPPADLDGTEATLALSIDAAGETYTDQAFVTLRAASATPTSVAPTKLAPAPPTLLSISPRMMLVALGVTGLAVLVLMLSALGVFNRRGNTVEERVAAFTRKGGAGGAGAVSAVPGSGSAGITAQAVGIAEKALGNKGIEGALGDRLEAAGISMKPAEWLLTHAGIAFGSGLIALLLSSGGIVATLTGLLLGAIVPWLYLGFKRRRRVKAFKAQLADTLQLMAGSLSAGLSLAQSVDTVVREGSEPISHEFRRAIVEARLGVDIEEALDSVGERMESQDFHWVVMAIRIQREVGGNLAELLTNVANTIREREYLERQVLALSAEGRLSTWILGGLPPGFMLYLTIANPEYLKPMLTTMVGWVLLGTMAVLLTVGIFWMKKLVKVEV